MTILTIILVHIGLLTYHHNSKKYLPGTPSGRDAHPPTHLLIVLGSGGHTAEMISMLKRAPLDPDLYTYRTYVVSSGDSFSARKAVEFEEYLLNANVPKKSKGGGEEEEEEEGGNKKESRGKDNNTSTTTTSTTTRTKNPPPQPYTIITVPRARKVHQSLLTAPISTIHCLWACLLVLQGKHPDQKHHPPINTTTHNKYPGYPDLILTNGPATAVCIILAATIIRTFNQIFPYLQQQQQQQQQRYHPTSTSTSTPHTPGTTRYLRTIFIESWARVTTLSLSGKLVLPLVDRFLVQWEGLEGYSYSYYSGFAGWMGGRGGKRGRGRAEYVGALVG
ncbi:hypothetical protein FQN50_004296 [Emmonsiellopsis sp. PD_5]|nr:hypothetical protein FQN50_004296 [Emmonsiellopsis sp. PD_5]